MFKTIKKPEQALKRFFLLAILLHCIMTPLAQAGEKVQIVTLLSSSIKPYDESLQGFYVLLDEQEIAYEPYEFILNGKGGAELISKIKALRPDIIHTVGTKATRLVKDKIKDIPIVFSMVLNPEASGLVEGMESPGNNLSGASLDIPILLQFEYMKKILPKTDTIGVIYSNAETGAIVAEAREVSAHMGIKLVGIEVDDPSDVTSAMKQLIGKVDFLWSVADSNVFTKETIREILLATLREKVPFMGLSPGFVRAGALVALDTDARVIGRKAAEVAASVIKGQSPGKIPVHIPNNVKIIINKNTIDLLDIDISGDIYNLAEVVSP